MPLTLSRWRSTVAAVATAVAALTACVGGNVYAQTGTGILTGTVRDSAGLPVPQVRITVARDGAPLATLTAADGRFVIEGVPTGQRLLEATKPGYRAAQALVAVPADSAIIVTITLHADAQELPGIVVQAERSNRVSGVVFDRRDRPVANVTVELIGLRRKVATDSAGRFEFLDIDEGLYLVQWRKTGFAVAQHSVRMTQGVDREFAVRLNPIGRERFTAELAATVALEATNRRSHRTGRSAIVGRDELEKFGRTRLIDVLPFSSGADAFRETPLACVLVNGFDAPAAGGSGPLARPGRAKAGPQSIHAEGEAVRNRSSTTMRSPPGLADPLSWLSFFRADEVEMVEIYPEGSEQSRTLCGRFSPSSGCHCGGGRRGAEPPDPAGFVVWTR